MRDDSSNAKPGAGTPGSARSALCGLVAFTSYRLRLPGANSCIPLRIFALARQRRSDALFWGEAVT